MKFYIKESTAKRLSMYAMSTHGKVLFWKNQPRVNGLLEFEISGMQEKAYKEYKSQCPGLTDDEAINLRLDDIT